MFNRYSTLVGQSRRQQALRDDISKLKDGGKQFQEFLDEAKCYADPSQPQDAVPCKTLSAYENSYVVYKDIELCEGDQVEFPRLSSYKDQYIDGVLTGYPLKPQTNFLSKLVQFPNNLKIGILNQLCQKFCLWLEWITCKQHWMNTSPFK